MKRKLSLTVVMLLSLALAGLLEAAGSPTHAVSPRTGSWSKTGAMTIDRYHHTATLLPNGQVLVTGGFSNSDTTARTELYTIKNGKWAKARPMSTPRVYHTATLLPNGKVLVVGGWINDANDSGNALASAEIYTTRTGRWTKTGSLTDARLGHTATLLSNGKVLVVGGTTDRQSGDGLASAELYDPTTGTWSATGSMSVSRVDFTATLLPDGKVLVAGGWDNNGDGSGNPLDTAELYDPTSGTWSATGSMSTPRVDHTATLLPNGQVLVVGGDDAGTAELYDPTSGTWATTDAMSTAHYMHTATLLPNGQVLIAGGTANLSSPSALNTAELYDPTAGTWSPASSMLTARLGHTATFLPNRKVLVAGGWNEDSLAKAELFSV